MTGLPNQFALVGARIYTAAGEPLDQGIILIEEGHIKAVGQGIDVPADWTRFDLQGKSITPGFIDAHCHIGVFNEGAGEVGHDGNDYGEPVQPMLRALDAIYPDDPAFVDALQNGITSMCISPGSGNVIGGQMALLKNRGNIVEDMLVDEFVGLKCAFGENPKVRYASLRKIPGTRMGIAAMIRKHFLKASQYNERKTRHHEEEKYFEHDPEMEVLGKILSRDLPLRAHAHRMDDIQTAIRIAEEFDLRLVIEHCTEGWTIADFLARKQVPVIIGPLNSTRTKFELRNKSLESAGVLEKAGVQFSIMSDAPVERIGALFDDVRLAIRNGLSERTALEAITIRPARILGYEKQIGSLESGKQADINVFSGDPFDSRNRVEAVIIDGKLQYGAIQ